MTAVVPAASEDCRRATYRFEIAPVPLRSSAQRYMEDSCVLVTSLASDRRVLQITDCLTLRSGADLVEPVPAGHSELLRQVHAVGGDVHARVRLLPKAGVTFDQFAGGWRFDWRTDGVQDPQLRGYRGSAPVRWRNGAIHQLQCDVYGGIIDIA